MMWIVQRNGSHVIASPWREPGFDYIKHVDEATVKRMYNALKRYERRGFRHIYSWTIKPDDELMLYAAMNLRAAG